MAHTTDIVGYTYKADMFCIRCTGLEMVDSGLSPTLVPESPDEIDTVLRAHDVDPEDLYSYDSDHYPKVVFRDQLQRTDSCGNCGDCLQCEGWGCEDCRSNQEEPPLPKDW